VAAATFTSQPPAFATFSRSSLSTACQTCGDPRLAMALSPSSRPRRNIVVSTTKKAGISWSNVVCVGGAK